MKPSRWMKLVVALGVAAMACGKDRTETPADAGTPLPQATCLDTDGDGFPGTGDCKGVAQLDCNDVEPTVFPGASEQCNGRDDDCNGQVDDGLTRSTWYRDADGDGVGAVALGEGCKPPNEGAVTVSGDCDDTAAGVHPGASETCNAIDDDCNGQVDDGLAFQDFYLDADGDGFGDFQGDALRSCQTAIAGRAANKTDCDDANAAVKPSAAELCNRIDDNCDGLTDNGIPFTNYYPDMDADGFGAAGASPESACVPIAGKVANDSDCNDTLASVKPGGTEVCNGQDDNCDGQIDEGLTFATYWPDQDGDGAGALLGTPQTSCEPVRGKVTNHTDCDDSNPAIKPGAPEVCNGIDDNCNGAKDDGLTFNQYFLDGDGDGFGAGQSVTACAPVAGRVTNNTDCNDANSAIKPGATELCNGVDDDCNARIDDGLQFVDYYPDGDGDGFGSANGTPLSSCQPVTGRVTSHTDCDDSRAQAHPGATEVCNGLDDDCVNGVDNGLTFTNYSLDADGDGHGRTTGAVSACAPPSGRVTSHDDCDDAVATTYPGAPELCNNADDNCDGVIDNGVGSQDYYPDADGDGFGAASGAPISSCTVVAGRVTNNTDCNDASASIHPGAAEVCNALDDDCNGQVDDGLPVSSWYPDADHDGYGAAGSAAVSSCTTIAGRVTNDTDCNDGAASVHPGAPETCNGLDDNCNGSADEGLPTQQTWIDADGDGFGAAGTAALNSCNLPVGRATNDTDCNDTNGAVRPNAAEICNSVDDNCNGAIDEGNPGGGASCSTGQLGVCAAGTLTCSTGAVTCVRTTGPSTEACNGLDDNCNGSTDEAFTGLGDACVVGQGSCRNTGLTICNSAGTGTTCSAQPGLPTAPQCDGIDNDCDGVVDEPVLTSTLDVHATAWADVEVKPYFNSPASCAGGTNGAGTDALAGGALVMAGGAPGLTFRALDAQGAPTGANSSLSSFGYADVDLAQAGDGFVVGGVYASGSEIDLYYVDRVGITRTWKYSNFKYPAGCSPLGTPCHALDSLRLVRGNGRKVSVIWREAGYGLLMAQVEACAVTGGWELRAPGCLTATLTTKTIASNTALLPGAGADSDLDDWSALQTCAAASATRRLAVAYRPNATLINFFTINDDGTSKSAVTSVATVSSPRTLAEPEVSAFTDAQGQSQFVVAYLTHEASPGTPQSDLNFWLTNDPTWHYLYSTTATAHGAGSISRPRVSTNGARFQFSAQRWVNDASGFAQQVMTRQTDLAGARLPLGSAVELSVTSGACAGDANCRPGNKGALTNWLPFTRLYYSASGATPAGSSASVLTCN